MAVVHFVCVEIKKQTPGNSILKIKILYTIPNFDTAGSGKALLNLALGLDKNIFEPHIACLNDKGDFFKIVKDICN